MMTRKRPSADFTSTQPAGTVIGQSPGGGAVVPLGSVVHLTLSNGKAPTAVVPEVVGLTSDAALAALQAHGLQGTVVPAPVHDQKQDGIVLQQSPASGQRVPDGTAVVITVGRFEQGPKPSPAPSTGPSPKPKPSHSPKPRHTKKG